MAKKFLEADNNKKSSYYSKIVSNYNTINEKLKESKDEILSVASAKAGIDFNKKN
jgi:predicted transcriptional regulator